MSIFIQSNNDWDSLMKVIVGRIDNSCIQSAEPQYNIKSNGVSEIIGAGPRNKTDIEKGNKQLNNFVKILEDEGIEVFRPDII